jgi:L-lactate dehydrogenase (cytochrome)
MFLFSLWAGGQQGVERVLKNMHAEIRRNMILMGCKSIKDLDNSKIIYKK